MAETPAGILFGFILGALVSGTLFCLHSTSDTVIQSGEEFYLDGKVYVCEITHILQGGSGAKDVEN